MVDNPRLVEFLQITMTHLSTLIERWRNGDENAAEAIYNLHKTRVYRLAYGCLSNNEDAEEAAQDALTYALLNIIHFDEKRSQFTTWLHMITISRCRDILRKRKMPTISLSEWLRSFAQKRPEKSTPESQNIEAEVKNSIWKAVQELSPPLREAIILRHWGAHTYQEIAEIVGCPLRTAQSRVRLAYGQLEKVLTPNHQKTMLKEISE